MAQTQNNRTPFVSRAMELQPVLLGDNVFGVFEHRSVLYLIRLTRTELTARALHGPTVPDPTDGVVRCLPLRVLESPYTPLLGPGNLLVRRPFA